MYDRSSGILMAISSLPSKYGIGTFGREAYNFIDFLHSSGQKYWQMLPMGPVSYGDSPYSSFSAYAGNPYFIDLEILISEGLLSKIDCAILESNNEFVDYEKQFIHRYIILYKAYDNSKLQYKLEINEFIMNNQWVLDYSLFMALKYHFNQNPWYKWDGDIVNRNEQTIEKYKILLDEKVEFWAFLQFLFYKQYFKLKEYANKVGIKIIGDMPIYIAEDSVEAWADRKLFAVDENMMPSLAAGVPPDAFSHDGQLWGNPVYNWGYLKEISYEWWIKRLNWSFKLYDLVRIDHFRGFDEFWAVPLGSKNAISGKWIPAHGKELLEHAINEIGRLNIIAEDLGMITDSVIKLKDYFELPGMKVLQFAFDDNTKNPYLPQNYGENSVAYTGTHDNDTLKGWFSKLEDNEKQYVFDSLNIKDIKDIKDIIDINDENKIIDKLIESVLMSKASLTIIPLQDYLCLGSQARMNTPSTLGGNWMWRVQKEMLTKELSEKIKSMTKGTNRIHDNNTLFIQ